MADPAPPQGFAPDTFAPTPPPGFAAADAPPNPPQGFMPAEQHAQQAEQRPQPNAPQPGHLKPLPWNQYSVDFALDENSQKFGLDRRVMRTMAQLESAGEGKNQVNALNKESGASGVMQLMPGTFASVMPKGKIFNLQDNVEAGSIYMKHLVDKYDGNYVIASGAYNMGPGAMDEYLAGKRALPPETARYMAYVQASLSSQDDTPIPPDPKAKSKQVPVVAHNVTPTPHQVQAKSNTNMDAAKHGFWDQMAGQADLPWILLNAHNMDEHLHSGNTHVHDALNLYFKEKNPAEAAQVYGLNSKKALEFYAQKDPDPRDREFADYLLKHPAATGWITFAEEMFNPLSDLEGRTAGLGLSLGWKAMQTFKEGRYLTHIASPWKGVVAHFGENARNIIAQIGMRGSQAGRDSADLIRNVFGTGEYDEGMQFEIGRLAQGRTPDPKYKALHPELARRAQILRKELDQLDEDQVKAGVLSQTTVDNQLTNNSPYIPTYGATGREMYNPITNDWIEQMRRPGSAYQKPKLKPKVFANLDELRDSGKMRPDWHIADAIERHVRGRRGNIALQEGLLKLSQKHPGAIKFGAQFSKMPPMGTTGQMVKASQVLPHLQMPLMKDAWIDKALADVDRDGNLIGFFNRQTGTIAGRSLEEDMPAIGVVHAAFRHFNGIMRGMMMYNPVFHPLWNIATNYNAVTHADVANSMVNYVSVIGNQIGNAADTFRNVPGMGKYFGAGKDAVEQAVWKYSQNYVDGLQKAHRAADAGAHAGIGGTRSFMGDTGAFIRTAPYSKLTMKQKMDKFITSMSDWNAKATFGPAGEEIFSTKLFDHFTKKMGMADEDAAWAVREALGNYANVSPDSIQSKLIFFYPWLKTNLGNWLRLALTNPAAAYSSTEAFDRQRQVAGDPREFDPNFEENPFSAYLGQDAEGGDVRQTLPLPQKDAIKAIDALGPGNESLTERGAGLLGMVAGRMNPVMGLGFDTAANILDRGKPAEPGDFKGYNVMYNKAATPEEQMQEYRQSALGRLIPFPFPYISHDIIRSGILANALSGNVAGAMHQLGEKKSDYLTELAGMGTISHSQEQGARRGMSQAANRLERRLGHINKVMYGPHPLTYEEQKARIQKAKDLYDKDVERVTNKLGPDAKALVDAANKRLEKNLAPLPETSPEVPPGFHPDEASPPPGFQPAQ